MTKAKLIKKEQTAEFLQSNKTQPKSKPVVKKTISMVNEWMEAKRTTRIDPRAAFAALFAQSQES